MTKQNSPFSGAVAALLDEYEKAIRELQAVISDVTEPELTKVVDPDTKDLDCSSIQSILAHVVSSGHNYAVAIRKSLGEDISYFPKVGLSSAAAFSSALDDMIAYNQRLFLDYPDLQLEEYAEEKKVLVGWGQRYDPDQLMEHAIVHILRHRRQIEHFLLRLRAD